MFGRGTSLSLSLSLLALFGILTFLNTLFLGFCALFVILSLCKRATQRVARRKPQQKNPHKLKENLPFLDTSLALSMTNSGFCLKTTDKENALCHLATIDKSHNFAHQKHFFTQILGTKFTNFIRFYGLPRSLCSLAMTADFVILSLCKRATQRVARRKPQQKNPQRLKENLPFLDTSLTLSMTNSGFCLKTTDKENTLCHLATIDKSHNFAHQKHFFVQGLGTKFTNFIRFFGLPRSLCSLAMTARQKFKFSTQNSIHFINFTQNSKHFINLSQILSHTQGFFISLPQIFEQFLLINLVERRSYGSSWHKRQDKNSRAD